VPGPPGNPRVAIGQSTRFPWGGAFSGPLRLRFSDSSGLFGHTSPNDRSARRPRWPSGGGHVAVKEPGLRSSSDERHRGREAAGGEGGVAISPSEGCGRGPEGAHELGVELVEPSCGRPSWPHGRAARETGQGGWGGPAGPGPGSP